MQKQIFSQLKREAEIMLFVQTQEQERDKDESE